MYKKNHTLNEANENKINNFESDNKGCKDKIQDILKTDIANGKNTEFINAWKSINENLELIMNIRIPPSEATIMNSEELARAEIDVLIKRFNRLDEIGVATMFLKSNNEMVSAFQNSEMIKYARHIGGICSNIILLHQSIDMPPMATYQGAEVLALKAKTLRKNIIKSCMIIWRIIIKLLQKRERRSISNEICIKSYDNACRSIKDL